MKDWRGEIGIIHPEDLRLARVALRVSQSRLERRSFVSRYKISQFELGNDPLSFAELNRIKEALKLFQKEYSSTWRPLEVSPKGGSMPNS